MARTLRISAYVGKIMTVVFALVLGIVTIVCAIILEPTMQGIINNAFDIQTSKIVELEGDDAERIEYYKTNYGSIAELKVASHQVSRDVQGEGAVLLKNELVDGKPALPLQSGNTVNLYDVTSVDPVWGGTGSGKATITGTSGPDGNYGGETFPLSESKPTFKKAFEAEDVGLVVNESLWNWYDNCNFKKVSTSGWPGGFDIRGASWTDIPNGVGKDAGADVGIFVLGRIGGEDYDRPILSWSESNGNQTKSFLQLTTKEKTVLDELRALRTNKTLKKLILIINSSNQPDLNWLTDDIYGFDAALWVGGIGQDGLDAIAELLVGKLNPSGRLVDVFWNKHADNPVLSNFGSYSFDTGTMNTSVGTPAERYVVYQEGMYLGYRYTETRYEDKVLGTANVGDFFYNDIVAYPFGYGLSYTSFGYTDFSVVKDARNATKLIRPRHDHNGNIIADVPTADKTVSKNIYKVSVTVTNTGSKAGKEVVQVYMQRPYTTYDKENGIEKPSIELVGFAKTQELAAGAEERVTIEVDEKYFAAYDSNGAGTYVVTPGNYYLAVGKDSHDALNNILAEKGKTTANGMTTNGNSAFAHKIIDPCGDTLNVRKYKYSDVTGTEIQNLFDFADLNRYEGARTGVGSDNRVDYVSRKDWTGTLTFIDPSKNEAGQSCQVVISKTAKMTEDQILNKSWLPKLEGDYPTYGAYYGEENKITLAAMALRNPDGSLYYGYDHPKWDEFLDQLTWDDYVNLLSDGKRTTEAVGIVAKPKTLDHNGPIGFIHKYADSRGHNWDKHTGFAGLSALGVFKNEDGEYIPNRAAYGKEAVIDPDSDAYPCSFPSNPVVAATFNVELAYKVGEMIGEDALWGGYTGIYGTGVNIHRTAHQGRAFEYYSEDGFLSGTIVAWWSRGSQDKGCYVYNKHLFLNEQELSRFGINTFVNEQTAREIYLRAFEIPIALGDAKAIMGALNRVGVQWASSCKALNTDWLRGEAGLSGFTVTDWWDKNNAIDNQDWYMQPGPSLMSGNDLPDGQLGKNRLNRYAKGAENENYEYAWAMRESAKRIMYTVADSNAMNGFTVNTKVVELDVAWPAAFELMQTLLWIPFILSAVLYVGSASTSFVLKGMKKI